MRFLSPRSLRTFTVFDYIYYSFIRSAYPGTRRTSGECSSTVLPRATAICWVAALGIDAYFCSINISLPVLANSCYDSNRGIYPTDDGTGSKPNCDVSISEILLAFITNPACIVFQLVSTTLQNLLHFSLRIRLTPWLYKPLACVVDLPNHIRIFLFEESCFFPAFTILSFLIFLVPTSYYQFQIFLASFRHY